MFILIVDVFESMCARFTFLGLKSRKVNFEVDLKIPHHFSMVFDFVESITFDASRPICMTCESYMTTFLAIFAL